MRPFRYSLFVIAAACMFGFASQASATIGWAGNVWPLHGSTAVPTGSVTVYAQVWKGGVTDGAGQGADITAELRYTTDIAPQASVAMVYNTDIGNNDEYKGDVPQAALVGASYVDVTVVFTDVTDNSTFEVLNDQAGHAPPLRYTVVQVLPNDVAVKFTLCMSGTPTSGAPCVIGSAAPIGSWGTGVSMNNVAGELWEVTVTFPAGSNPAFEYKYRSDGCVNWEFVGNRSTTLPTDGTTAVNLNPDSFNNAPMGCGLGEVLLSDQQVNFQVCTNVGSPAVAPGLRTTGVCVIGSVAQLGTWVNGVDMNEISPGLFEAAVVFPAGMPVQLVEFKYKKDACSVWESTPNRQVTVDNGSPSQQTLTNNWEDRTGGCASTSARRTSWGKLKVMYR